MSAETAPNPPVQLEPTGRRRLLLRTSVFLFSLAAIYFGYQTFQRFMVDPDLGTFASEGMVAVVESGPNGSRAVLLDRDGKELFTSGPLATSSDRDLVWRPDGQRLMFTSDREKNVYQLFRWNPGANKVEARTVGTSSKARPVFGPPGFSMTAWTGLVVTGGSP